MFDILRLNNTSEYASDIGPQEYNQNVLLKDHRVEKKQSFKHNAGITEEALRHITATEKNINF